MTLPIQDALHRRRILIALSLSLGLAIAYGLESHSLFAQTSYAPGTEGQIWQQLPTFGRGVDLGNERPISTAVPPISDPDPLGGIADVWPCTVDAFGFPVLCYSSGTIGVGPGAPPDVAQNFAGRFAPCVLDQCYPSGSIGVGPAVTWAFGPCAMQGGAEGTDCYPSGTAGSGPRVPPANGQFAGPVGIAVDNTPNVGTIYVTDHWNHRVQAFLFDGTLVSLAHPIGNGHAGSGPYTQVVGAQTFTGEQLSFPESIKVDASHHLVIADSGGDSAAGRVAVFDTTGVLVDSLTIPNAGDVWGTGFAHPTGVALTPGASFRGAANAAGSRLVVTDGYNCAVYVFDASSLNQLAVVGGAACADTGTTLAPEDIATVGGVTIDTAGHAYTADYDRNRIEMWDTNGMFLGAFGDPLSGAVAPAALHGPTDVMVDHRGVYTETDAGGPHQVARVWVVDSTNQRLAVFKVNFDTPVPVASWLFDLNAAGDLNGFPRGIAEDTSRDAVGKIVTTDPGNSRIQRFQVPDLAVVNVVSDAFTRTVFFDVLVPSGKDPAGVTTVTPIVCPTSANTSVSSGVSAPQTGCALARSLTPTALMTPGQSVTYSFSSTSSLNTAAFDIFATGNPDALNGNIPATTSNHAPATVTNTCPTCAITPQVALPGGALEALTVPVAPSTLYIGARIYTTQVSARLTATSSLGLTQMLYRFVSGPETGNNGQPGLHTVTVSGTSASFDVSFRLEGTSVLEYWAQNTDGTGIVHGQAQLTLHLAPPDVNFRFDRASSPNATQPNAAGWWNRAVTLPLDFAGQITAVTPLGAGMPANPALSSPLLFTTEGRNLAFKVTVTDSVGLSTTKSSSDPESSNDDATVGRPVNIDMTAPTFVASPALTFERASFDGAPPLNGGAPALALATDPNLSNGNAGSGVVGVAPASVIANFPFGTSTQALVATDAAGNTKNGNVSVTVRDTIKPVLTCPATLTINPGALGTVFSQPGFSVSDASMINAPAGATPVAVTQSVPATQILAVNTTTSVTLTARDPSNNSITCVTSVTAKLLTPPYFTRVPPNQTVEGGGAAIDLNATAVDAVGTSSTVTSNSPATFPLGATTVTFTAKDASDQTVTASVVITVVDTKAPAITACAAPVTLYTSATAPAALPNMITGVTAADFSTFTVTQSPAAGTENSLPPGQDTLVVAVTLTVTDNSPARNASTCSTTVTIRTLPPPVMTQSNVTAVTNGAGGVVTFVPTVVDVIDGTNHDLVSCTPASGSWFPVGTTSVTCTATDSAGLTSSVTFTVTMTHIALDCTAAKADPGILWPPNHRLVTIAIAGLTTIGGGAITTNVTSIFQDEPTNGLGDGDTAIDGFIVNGVAQVRAERSGLGDGRMYHIGFTATTAGGTCTGTVTVGVPHDQAHTAVGGGPRFDSTKNVSAQGDRCHGLAGHGHHDGDGCEKDHHGHFDGDDCKGKDGHHHDGDGSKGKTGDHHERDGDDRDRREGDRRDGGFYREE